MRKNFALQKNALNFSGAALGPSWLVLYKSVED